MDYDYPKLIAERSAALKEIEGQTLEKVLVQVVAPEFNGLYLQLTQGWYVASGEIGSEILGFHKMAEAPIVNRMSDLTWVGPFQPFDIFVGKKVALARHIGEAWNGHGFELSFEALPDKTMIVQSIYTGSQPKEFNDCIRLGIGQYYYDAASK